MKTNKRTPCNCGAIEGHHIRAYGLKDKEFAWCEELPKANPTHTPAPSCLAKECEICWPRTHTPTLPVKIVYEKFRGDNQIQDAAGVNIAIPKNHFGPFIVQAVNAHEDLLMALKLLHDVLENNSIINWDDNSHLAIARRNAHDVIAKAEGK